MKNILNGKVLIAMVVIALVLLCGSLAYILVMRPAASSLNLAEATSVLTIIPAPSSTPRPLPPTLDSAPAHPGTIFLSRAWPDCYWCIYPAQYRRGRAACAHGTCAER